MKAETTDPRDDGGPIMTGTNNGITRSNKASDPTGARRHIVTLGHGAVLCSASSDDDLMHHYEENWRLKLPCLALDAPARIKAPLKSPQPKPHRIQLKNVLMIYSCLWIIACPLHPLPPLPPLLPPPSPPLPPKLVPQPGDHWCGF